MFSVGRTQFVGTRLHRAYTTREQLGGTLLGTY